MTSIDPGRNRKRQGVFPTPLFPPNLQWMLVHRMLLLEFCCSPSMKQAGHKSAERKRESVHVSYSRGQEQEVNKTFCNVSKVNIASHKRGKQRYSGKTACLTNHRACTPRLYYLKKIAKTPIHIGQPKKVKTVLMIHNTTAVSITDTFLITNC